MKRKNSVLITLVFVASLFVLACSAPKSEEEKQQEKKELKEVDQQLKTDQERMDSMKKALNIEE